jgi:hypothetical protein
VLDGFLRQCIPDVDRMVRLSCKKARLENQQVMEHLVRTLGAKGRKPRRQARNRTPIEDAGPAEGHRSATDPAPAGTDPASGPGASARESGNEEEESGSTANK